MSRVLTLGQHEGACLRRFLHSPADPILLLASRRFNVRVYGSHGCPRHPPSHTALVELMKQRAARTVEDTGVEPHRTSPQPDSSATSAAPQG